MLIIEDDANIVDATSLLLEDAGYEVLSARNAEQAHALVEQRPDIDVVFTDVNLHGAVNGIELARQLKQRGSRASTVVVSGDLGWADTQLDADMRFLAKPYGRQTLLAAVAEACARKSQV
ncbi:response regulator [Aerosticca soli]|uniref:response regulator n=1 Tax=Aerosticca soli TaxID=2010829 RepID=UPI00138726F8|nr:response regulator [Aerosticca soli]